MTAAPFLREVISDGHERFTEIWSVEPPHAGVSYIVRRESWNVDHSERTILEIEVLS